MAYYYPIQNEKLRLLVMVSESINSLEEKLLQKMVFQIAALPKAGQEALIEVLEDEQRQITAAKRAKGITPAMELAQIKDKTAQVRMIRRNFDLVVRVENEKVEVARAQTNADDLLREMD